MCGAVKCRRGQFQLAADPSVTSSLANGVLKPELRHDWTRRGMNTSSTPLILGRNCCLSLNEEICVHLPTHQLWTFSVAVALTLTDQCLHTPEHILKTLSSDFFSKLSPSFLSVSCLSPSVVPPLLTPLCDQVPNTLSQVLGSQDGSA